jgi:hypothetical protein
VVADNISRPVWKYYIQNTKLSLLIIMYIFLLFKSLPSILTLNIKFGVVTEILMKFQVSRNVTSCRILCICQRFGGTTFPCSIINCLPVNTKTPKKILIPCVLCIRSDVIQIIRKCFNPLNAELNHICHLLTLLGAHPIFHISRIRVNMEELVTKRVKILHAYLDFFFCCGAATQRWSSPPHS